MSIASDPVGSADVQRMAVDFDFHPVGAYDEADESEGRSRLIHMCAYEYTKNNDRAMTRCICLDCVCFFVRVCADKMITVRRND